MIARIFLFSSSFLLGSATAFAGFKGNPAPDSSVCLVLQGQVVNAPDDRSAVCYIELLRSGGGTDTLVLSGKRSSFRFSLVANSYYAIRITKTGYLPRLISINTACELDDFIHKFRFRTALIPEKEKTRLNADALDFPVAIIHYDEEHDDFHYNEAYTLDLKRDLYRTGALSGQISRNP